MAGHALQHKTAGPKAASVGEASPAARDADTRIEGAHVTQLRAIGATLNSGPRAIANRSLGEQLNRGASPTRQGAAMSSTRPNGAGLPDRLKAGIEGLSGLSMGHVRVHYNSGKPAQLQALAYAQGSTIHLGPGQERHLPHEAWHVVQQARGQVRPTAQLARGVALNDETALEREADRMGARAAAWTSTAAPAALAQPQSGRGVAQRRPANIVMSYSVPFHHNAETGRDSYRGFRGQRTPHAAQPINELRSSGVIETVPDQDFIGGHLLKAEYGGADTPKNVVPWSAKAERTFSAYEAGYLANIGRYRAHAERLGKIEANGDWTWPFYVAAEFADWEGGGDKPTQEKLSAIPVAVTVNPGSTADYFHITGAAISGRIEVQDEDDAKEGDAHAVAPVAMAAPVDAVVSAKNKFKHNIQTCASRVYGYLEESKDDPWIGDAVVFGMTQLQELKDGLMGQIVNIVDNNPHPVAVAPVTHVRTLTHFNSKYGSGISESARREALENPIAMPRRTEARLQAMIEEVVARYRQILINNLILLAQALRDQQPSARKQAMGDFVEECFA